MMVIYAISRKLILLKSVVKRKRRRVIMKVKLEKNQSEIGQTLLKEFRNYELMNIEILNITTMLTGFMLTGRS